MGAAHQPFRQIDRAPTSAAHLAFSEEKMSTTISSEQGQVPERASIDESKIAYQRPQPFGMVPDAFVGSALDLDGDEREWVPQSPTVSFKPLILSVSQGFYINILRVRSSGVLSRHRHTGAGSRCEESGATSNTTGSQPQATMPSSRRARRTPSSFQTTCRKWRRSSTSQAATRHLSKRGESDQSRGDS
jgi:hypothetical protein